MSYPKSLWFQRSFESRNVPVDPIAEPRKPETWKAGKSRKRNRQRAINFSRNEAAISQKRTSQLSSLPSWLIMDPSSDFYSTNYKERQSTNTKNDKGRIMEPGFIPLRDFLTNDTSWSKDTSSKDTSSSKSSVKRTTFSNDFPVFGNGRTLQEQSSSVCANDPCGAGVACHPTAQSFICFCSDGTQVEPRQQCPEVHPVNVTPPAISMSRENEVVNKPSQVFLLGLTVTLLSLLFLLSISLCFWKRKQISYLLRHRQSSKIHKQSSESIAKSSVLLAYNFASNPNYYSPYPDQPIPIQSLSVPLLSKDDINFIGDLGEGCFGKVYKGTYQKGDETKSDDSSGRLAESSDAESEMGFEDALKKDSKEHKSKVVAVKMLKELVGVEAEAEFLREVEIMSTFKHPNILSLIGVVVTNTGGTPWMVFEYMPFGDLAEFLRSCNENYIKNKTTLNDLSSLEMLDICIQVAAGMEYLALQHFVHRDLACRNCLVGENLSVKISDFGMSRDVYTCDYYKVGGSRMLPVRWMAPESILYGKFTLESDVWSFGVVLWEVWSLGKQPYYGNSNEEVVQLILEGILLRPSGSCPPLVREVMRLCWSTEPDNRLRFPEIFRRLVESRKVLLESVEDSDGSTEKVTYSTLASHLSPAVYKELPIATSETLSSELPTDADQYLLPKGVEPIEKYLTLLQS